MQLVARELLGTKLLWQVGRSRMNGIIIETEAYLDQPAKSPLGRETEGTYLMKQITITVEDITLTAELNESKTAQRIYDSLPVESTVNVWGHEIYFNIPVALEPEPDARPDVEVGTLGYWPLGSAFCVFFGFYIELVQ